MTHWLPEIPVRKLWVECLLIFTLGLGLRIGLLTLTASAPVVRMEPINLAISLLEKGSYSDPFGGPSGPSAHCMPLHPLLSAALLWAFGLGTEGARALSYASSAAAALGYALLPLLAAYCGLSRWTGLAAGLGGALLPINFWSQTSGGFDASYSLLALTALSCCVAKDWRVERFEWRNGILTGFMAAIACLFNAGTLAIVAGWGVIGFVLFANRRWQFVAYFAVLTGVMGLGMSPWIVRNQMALGGFVPTRSNFGLEFQVSNNSEVTHDLEANVRRQAWSHLHPSVSVEELEKVRRLGEVAYHAAKLREGRQWVSTHQDRFWELTRDRVIGFWFPKMLRPWQSAGQALITVLASLGLVLLLRRNVSIGLFLGGASICFSMVYTMIQVSMRYRFPIEGFLLLLAADLIFWRIKTQE